MRFRFIRRYGRAVFCLLMLAIVLRSFIAPGYMFDFNADVDFGIGIILCPGPNGISTTALPHDSHHDHEQHPSDHEQHAVSDSSICGLLYASTTFIQQIESAGEEHAQGADGYSPTDYNPPSLPEACHRTHPPRAPPAYSLT